MLRGPNFTSDSGCCELSALTCLVQSNADILVNGGATITAAMVAASGAASGVITPTPQVGAPPIPDPFASLDFSPPVAGCVPVDSTPTAGVYVLPAGVHCGNILAAKGVTLQLAPGEHYFLNCHLELKQNAVLTRDDVALIFDDKSDFKFGDQSRVTLQGRRSGAFAGFVIATTPANTGVFAISSDSVSKLLGTIYIPNATLAVSGAGNQVAQQSAWTVIVAKALDLSGTPNLVINANYAASTVPTPPGVGPRGGRVVLQK